MNDPETMVGTAPRIVFLFTGQGSQYRAMGGDLYQTYEVFRATLDACSHAASRLLREPLLPLIIEDGDAGLLDQTEYTQPALFSLEVGLARLWASFGLQPSAVLGHSIGEIAAAHVAGGLTLEDAMDLVTHRGILMRDHAVPGAMLAIAADARKTRPFVESVPDIDIAAINNRANTAVSGPQLAITELEEKLRAAAVPYKALRVSHGFHSRLMEPALDPFLHLLYSIPRSPLQIPMALNLDGSLAQPGHVLGPEYWAGQMRNTVRFREALYSIVDAGFTVFVEVGPHPVLCGLGSGELPDPSLTWLPSLRRGRPGPEVLTETIERLTQLGCVLGAAPSTPRAQV